MQHDPSENLKAVLENTVDGIFFIDGHGNIETFNLACEKIFGYSRQEVIGQNVKLLMPELYHSEHDGNLKKFHETAQKKIIGTGREVLGRKKDGTIFPIDLSVSEVTLTDRKIYSGIVRDISKRKADEQTLKDLAGKLTAVMDAVGDGIITINKKGIIQTFNRAATQLFGYTVEEVLNQNINILMPEPYHSEHDNYISNYTTTRVPKVIGTGREVVVRRKDGSTFAMHLSISSINVFDEEMFVGVIRDLSLLKQVDLTLKVSEEYHKQQLVKQQERWNLGLKAAKIGIWEYNLLNNALHWDDEMFRLYGRTPADFEGAYLAWEKGLHEDDKQRAEAELAEAIAGGKPFNTKFRVKTPDGRIRILKAVAEVHRDSSGKPTKMIGANIDITESDELELIAKERLREIEKGTERFQLVAEGASVGIWDWFEIKEDKEYWSPKFYELLGYENNEIPSSLTKFGELLHPEDQEMTFQKVKAHLECDDPFEIEYRLKTKSGLYRWFKGTGIASGKKNSQFRRMVGSIQDIHEKKLLEKERERRELELKRSNQELEQFAYVASHDLQAPIRHITSFISLIKKKMAANLTQDPDLSKWFDFITEGSETMGLLLKDLLAYSRIQKEALIKENIDLNLTLEKINKIILHANPNATIRISNMPTVRGYPTQLFQLFQNLIQNAVKFNKPEAKPHVEINFSQNEKEFHFTIKDNGIGIEKSQQERIFHMFQRLHTKEEYEGTGIGLAICKKIVDYHGGKIWVESEINSGCTFHFTLTKQDAL